MQMMVTSIIRGLDSLYVRSEQCSNCVPSFHMLSHMASIYLMLTMCQSHQRTNPDMNLGRHGAHGVVRYRVLYTANSSHTSDFKGDFTDFVDHHLPVQK